MANKIYISFFNPYKGKMDEGVFPLTEDPLLELQSNFQSMEDMIPSGIMSMVNLMKNVNRISGGASKSFETLLALPLWQKTEPLTIVANLVFYTKDRGAFEDVWLPTMGLASQSILIDKGDGKFSVPGISLKTYASMRKSGKNPKNHEKVNQEGTNLISLEIPGIVYLENAVLMHAKPTFSKQLTTGGYPLWGTLNIMIRSIYPANDKMFSQTVSLAPEILLAEAKASLIG